MGALIAIYILSPLATAEPANPYAFAAACAAFGAVMYGWAHFIRYSYRRDKKRTRYSDPW